MRKKHLTKKNIKIQIVYKPSPEAKFRLSKALEMLVSEKDIRNYFQAKVKKRKISRRRDAPIKFDHDKINNNLYFLTTSHV